MVGSAGLLMLASNPASFFLGGGGGGGGKGPPQKEAGFEATIMHDIHNLLVGRKGLETQCSLQ